MRMLKAVLPLILCAATMPALAQRHITHPTPGAPAPIHNGLWWQSKSDIFRDGFMNGYKSGSLHMAGHPTELSGFASTQLIDGINSFYRDFRNRMILVDDALHYVTEQLQGVSDDKLNAEILKMRAAAAPPDQE